MRKLLFLLLLLPLGAKAADLDVIRAQYIGYYTAAGASRSTPRMQEALGALEQVTRGNTAPGFLREDGSWSDIDYDDTPDGGWSPWAHTQRLIVMAKAYQTPGQPYYKNAALRSQLNSALAYTRSFYGANEIPTGNWWFWTMGIPLDLGPTLVLMRDEMDPGTYNDLVYAIALRIGSNPAARGLVGPVPTGENLVWSCFTHLTLGLLKDDPSMLTAVATAVSGVVRPTAAEGIKFDRSFHQHGAQLYTGGYGGSFAADVARLALITRGTSYSLSSDALASFSDYVADGIAWSLYGDYFDVSVISREVARPSSTGFQGLAAMLQAAEFASPRQGEIRSAAAKMLQSWRGTMTPELAGLAAQIETSGFPAAWPSGHRHYFSSDYTIHRRPNWFASVKMFSTRTKSGERTNGENLLGARQSDGRFYLVLQGNEYFGRDIWPALDWTRLPGITVEQKADTASAALDYGKRSYAGGTGDGQNGVSAMELAPLSSSLFARKSWFFFDDAIVFLTSGITAPNPNRVETIVNQWPLMNANSQLARGSDWAQLEGVGYWLPSSSNLATSREQRSGTWASLGASDDQTAQTKSFVTMWLDHGTAPVNATAEYAIVPNVSAAQMQQWAAARPISILANNERVSAARDNRTGAIGIAFWAANASVDGIQSSAQAVVYINGRDLWAADPNAGATGSFTITVPLYGSYTIPRASGQTTHIVMKALPVKRRAAGK
ncbi:MAG TPA: polysaccharide lyase family 8 super-sandwich domain-containing protein [Thermoanaerobaculia bacterium]|nr:polysaccharide lyase family 8 super-sandwich domain-containing protein [Thermoanaerobaculia bacterium]